MKNYSYEEIYDAMTVIAKVIKLHGDVYLPIFERLQDELEKAEKRKKVIDLANQIAVS